MLITAGAGECTTAWHNILDTTILTFQKVQHPPLAIIKPWGDEKLSARMYFAYSLENAFPFPVPSLKRTDKVLCVLYSP